MYKVGGDEMVFCPYNRFHVVSKLRIQKHIIKCKTNNPDVKLATCFYNYTHRLRPEDMLQHYEICPGKTRIDDSRYSELYCSTSSNISIKSEPYTEKYPDINVKPRIFPQKGTIPSSSSQAFNDGDSCSTGSEFATDYPELIYDGFDDDDDDDDDHDLEPLRLPKTVQKAFVYANKEPNNFIPQTSQPKNFLPFSPSEKSDTSDHLLSDHQTVESESKNSDIPNRELKSISSSILKYKVNSSCKSQPKDCSASITSSMFDDISTLKSVDVLSDVESTEEENGNDGFIFTKFKKYVRI